MVQYIVAKNCDEKINLKNLLNIWLQHKLSMKGKIAVLRLLALP